MDAPSLQVFMSRLDGAWRNLAKWEMSLPKVGELEQGDLQGFFQPKPLIL